MPLEEAEAEYGMSIPDRETMFELQRLEAGNPIRVHEWIEEGMTVEAMGNPKTIEAFRERQTARPDEVPFNIERQNRHSVLRSEKAAGDTGSVGDTGVPESVRDVIQSRGRLLETSIQRAMEDRMGDSFCDVRIHADATAAKACEEINARAFTVGNHVAFNSGEYDPHSPEGQHVLVHELAHVRQQTGGAVSMLPQEGELEIDPDSRFEREAEETAQRVMRGGKLGVHRMRKADLHIQRMPGEEFVSQARGLVDTGVEKINESTTKSYRLTKDQLVDMVQSVETPKGSPSTLSTTTSTWPVACRTRPVARSKVRRKAGRRARCSGPSPALLVSLPAGSLACH